MHQAGTQQHARSVPFPRLWLQRRERTSRERLQSWKSVTLATDVLMLIVAATAFDVVSPSEAAPLGWIVVFSGVALAMLAMRGLYALRLRVHFLDELPPVVGAMAVAAMAVIAIRVLVGGDPDAAKMVHYWMLASACLIAGRAGTHFAQARARRHGEDDRPTLIVGAGQVGHLTAKRLLERPELGLRPIGFLDKEPLDIGESSVGLPVLGASWDLDRTISEHGVQHVIVTFSTAPHHVLLGLTRRCWEHGVSVSLVPRLFEVEGQRVLVEHLGGLPLVPVDAADPRGWQFTVKYAIDRVVAALALLLMLPLLAGTALAVRLSMGAPLFYRQKRVGRDGRVFDMLKFRTMDGRPEDSGEADADWAMRETDGNGGLGTMHTGGNGAGRQRAGNGRGRSPADAADGNGGTISSDSENGSASLQPKATDDRRTPLGRLLRKFSLDELPQLLNVLRGDMSLIGPRPERVTYVRRFEDTVYRYKDRHRVKSGITGWAQVNGLRGKTSLADRVEWDNYYVEKWSPWLDIKIIFLTVACVLRGDTGEQRQDRPGPRSG